MNYIIKGGEFNNKGAEAMTLIAIDNIKKRDKDANIYIYDYGYDMSMAKELNITPFKAERSYIEFLAGHKTCYYILSRIKNYAKFFLKRKFYTPQYVYKYSKKIIENADFFIDISGYYLTTRFKDDHVDFYLSWIEALNILNPDCKIYLMPQSFGPFDNSLDRIRAYDALSTCKIIFAREENGLNDLKKIGLNNIRFCYDSVLIDQDYMPQHILKNYDRYKEMKPNIVDNSVAIIPNARLLDAGGVSKEKLIDFYSIIIDELSQTNKVYLIPHAGEDVDILDKIKEKYLLNSNVILVDRVLNSFIFEEVIKKCNFVIASRYHSIIHAYREGVPAVILGWSEKYDQVASVFDQNKYLIDIHDKAKTADTIKYMTLNYEKEKAKILSTLKQIQSEYNCYSFLGENNED